eukprot:TRINITY_DN188_c0_g1_i1.p2 TRINITY_DN188_c0_g1~~TRINITY_DN188_c0_g1_i1.p2  ORF type:complete len:154 (-),score=36.91 TRINITY_DN188_c0_g1_i1:38-457(-)
MAFLARFSVLRTAARVPLARGMASGAKLDPSEKKIPTDMEQATGLEREEIEQAMKGKQLFETEVVAPAFGTKEHPIVIKSAFSSRIVGCYADCAGGHELDGVVWHKVEAGHDYTCQVCNQVMRLKVGYVEGEMGKATIA